MDVLGILELNGEYADLRYERRYPRPIETVWAALTEPARLADWFAPARVEPRLGGRYELFVDRPQPMLGRILAWEPPRLLEFSWNTDHGGGPESVVRCELTPDGDGTRLVFRHRGLGFTWTGLVLPGWHAHLERLARLLAGGILPLNMQRWRALQKLYLEHCKLEGVMLDPPPGHRD